MARDLQQIPPDATEEPPEPPRLRMLRRMVLLLTATMIVAMLTIVVAVVWSMTRPAPSSLAPPVSREIAVPEGATVLSVSRAGDRLYLLLEDGAGARWIEERAADDRRLIARYRLVPDG